MTRRAGDKWERVIFMYQFGEGLLNICSKLMKKLIALTISLLLILACTLPCFATDTTATNSTAGETADTDVPTLYGDAALVMNLDNGDVLYSLNENELRYPASLTKMLTGILAVELLNFNSTIEVDSETAAVGGNSLHLKAGELINAKDLVYASIVFSANDGATAIAKAISGSVEKFAVLMNAKLQELGCENTHFVNPHGLHDNDHYTTASDLAKIAYYCMQNETFRDIVSTAEYTVPATNMSDSRTVHNTNLLLWYDDPEYTVEVNGVTRTTKYDGCIGIKTGSTGKAGACLACAAKRDGITILAITLHSKDSKQRCADGIALLDYGFAQYESATIMDAGVLDSTIKVKHGKSKTLNVKLEQDITVTIRKGDDLGAYSTVQSIEEKITAPVNAGDILGHMDLYKNDELIDSYDIVAESDVPENGFWTMISNIKIMLAKLGLFAYNN